MLKKLIFLIKWHIVRPQAFKQCAKLVSHSAMTYNELESAQEQARRRIVRIAMRTVPFYAKLYADAGFSENDIGKDGWFEKLPIVTKQHLRNHFREMVNPALGQYCKVSTTGGSSGVPTKSGYDGRLAEEAYGWRVQQMHGVYPWEDHAYI